MTNLEKFRKRLSEPVDGHVLGLFRLMFGLFMVYYAFYFYSIDFITEGLLKPKVLFKFDYLEWIRPLPLPAMYTILLAMGTAAVLMTLGLFFRAACWVFSLCLAYFFFLEKSYYNNHIYLFILLPLLLSATDADRFFSLRNKNRPFAFVPRWQQFILQAQIVIVYFYAGIVKFKADWLLRKEPMTSLVHQLPDTKWIAVLIKHEFVIDLFTYGGFLLDILTPVLLWYKPVRNWAWIPFALFHLFNSQVFDDIHIFPFVMLGALTLFFDTHEIPVLRNLSKQGGTVRKKTKVKSPSANHPAETPAASGAVTPATRTLTKNLLLGYFTFQVLFPFRGFFLPNPMDYTTIGNRFAWRVKADTRAPAEMVFGVINPATQEVHKVYLQSFLNEMQIRALSADPRTVAAFARYLRDEAVQRGIPNAQVKARIRFGYNGRPPQFFVNPDADLALAKYSPFRKLDWVILPADPGK